jgi:hypothetical protein
MELALPSGTVISVPVCFRFFERWQGKPICDDYGHKAVLDMNGEPLFAELAILRLIQAGGWQAVWIDTYGKRFLQSLPQSRRSPSCDLPAHAAKLLGQANADQKWHKGCPDVLAWSEGSYLFVEAKRRGRDAILKTQLHWLESARAVVPLDSILIFEWDVSEAKSVR